MCQKWLFNLNTYVQQLNTIFPMLCNRIWIMRNILLLKYFSNYFQLNAMRKNRNAKNNQIIVLWLGKNWHWQGRQLPSYIKRVQLKNHSPLFTWFYVTNGAFGHGWCKQVYLGSQKRRVGPTTLTQHINIKSRSNLLVDLDRNTHKECSSPNFDKRTWLSINSFFF